MVLKKDLNQLNKLLEQYSKEALEEGCNTDNMKLVKLSNWVKNTLGTIRDIEYIRKNK